MNRKGIVPGLVFLLTISVQLLNAQTPEVKILTTDTKTSIRGLSVVNDNIIWVSGSHGMVGKSTNAGRTWNWMTVRGFDTVEFRDIEAFDGLHAIIMKIESPACILRTEDGGESWHTVYKNETKGMFLDAMDFSSGAKGIVVGDPINGKVFIAETANNGETWQEWAEDKKPVADSGEAFFAASGTNIRLYDENKYFLVSGGTRSRLFTNGSITDIPIIQGKETTGANSIAVFDKGNMKGSKQMVVVGGDFLADSSMQKNCYYTNDGGKTWKEPKSSPHGYRSSVEYLSEDNLLSCGLNGVDHSIDGGKNWKWISKEGFNVCRIAKVGTAVFLAGNNGKIAKIIWR
jgi:photosystem II stability/assembly factor-like uncharacterized protein